MKKIISVILILAMAVTLTACGGGASEGKKVSLNGSTSMEKLAEILAEAYTIENSDTDVTYDPTGSSAGIKSILDGTADVGLSSRKLKESETGIEVTTIALDGISIITNKANDVSDLTIQQLADIATGKVENWSEVGGSDLPVVFVGREAGSGTRDGFESIVGVEEVCKYDQELTATGAIIAAVLANENAIGYASLASVSDTVNTVKIDGVEPSEATVTDGSYKIQRPFLFLVKEGEEQSQAVKEFIEYAKSDAVTEFIKLAGVVPFAG